MPEAVPEPIDEQVDASGTSSAYVLAQRRKVGIAGLLGTTIEWYEYYVYGATAALVFPQLFFPVQNRLASLMLSFASFAVAFAVRPIGAAVFGHFGDRVGRKRVLIMTLTLTGAATFLVGLVPTYASIGIWAPVMLTLLRIIQGFGVGGEWAGAALLSLEWGDQKRRGAAGSWPQMGTSVGLILSTLAVLLATTLPNASFLRWGWRIPFLMAGPLIVVGFVVRMSIDESPSFAREKAMGALEVRPLFEVLKRYRREVVLTALLRMSENMPFYVFTAFVLDYAVHAAGVSRTFVLTGTLASAVVDLALVPLSARLADRVGRRRMYFWGCAVLALMAVPYFWALRPGQPVIVFVALALSLVPHAMQYGVEASLIAEQFPAQVRYTGAGLGYQLSSMIAGGPAPLIAAGLLAAFGTGYSVAGYLVFGALVSAVALWMMRDPSAENL